MDREKIKQFIEEGNAVLGMELGSTRIKAILIGSDWEPLALGSFGWENRQTSDGFWTYSLDDVCKGVQSAFGDLKKSVSNDYGCELRSLAAAGCSAMMHGYLALDQKGSLLVPFRTWRNNTTARAAEELTKILEYPIPQRWSIAHLYQAVLDGEDHLEKLDSLYTLSSWIHWKLTGEKVIGTGDASGMFPVDPVTGDYDVRRMDVFNRLAEKSGFTCEISHLLPRIVPVGECAGRLNGEGARFLDPEGRLQSGFPLAAPEGDAGTGMVATGSVRERTGNVSAGTSVFAMLVLEKEPESVHKEIDLVTTPDGKLVAMAHSNNCTSEIDTWVNLFAEAAGILGGNTSEDELYGTLLSTALDAQADCGGLLSYGYVSGEHITGFSEGRPLFVRPPGATLTLANFMRCQLFSALCALRLGLNVLMEEGVRVDEIRGHGGFFKTPETGKRIMAAATLTPVSLLDNSGEGGAWGMALLAEYMIRKDKNLLLPDYLDRVLSDVISEPTIPDPEDVRGFNVFLERYKKGLPIEQAAVEYLE